MKCHMRWNLVKCVQRIFSSQCCSQGCCLSNWFSMATQQQSNQQADQSSCIRSIKPILCQGCKDTRSGTCCGCSDDAFLNHAPDLDRASIFYFILFCGCSGLADISMAECQERRSQVSMHLLWVAPLLLCEERLHLYVQVVPGPCVSVPVPGSRSLPLLLRQCLQHLLLPASGNMC